MDEKAVGPVCQQVARLLLGVTTKNKDMRIRKPFRCPTVQCSVRNTMDGILEKELGLSSLGGYLILQDTKRMQIVPLIARHIWHRAR